MNCFAYRLLRRSGRLLPAALSFCLLQSCATVTVRKIPTPTQYEHWTDDMQKQADLIQGIRFYLPRPFVNVFESFPVRTDVNFASGVISPDGKYVLINKIYGKPGSFISTDVSVPTGKISFPAPPTPEGIGGPKIPTTSGTPPTEPSTGGLLQQPAAPTTPPSPLPPNSPSPKTGQNQQSSTNNNFAFAYQPLRGNFDLVYMPDFEEQYAVNSYAGLGNANFQVNLGQGWSLQGYNSLTDNSEINKRIFDLIDTSMQLAKSAASAELGQVFPLLQQAAKSIAGPGTSAVTPHGLGGPTGQTAPAGTPVSMKIVMLHYAAKGLYPVIKPRELQERVARADVVYDVLDLFKLFPRPEYSTNFDQSALSNAQQAVEPESANSTIPRYPYQFISFNTFRYVAVEVITPDSPFATKYSATGTDDDPGAARTADPIELLKQLKALFGSASDGNNTPNNPAPQQPQGPDDQTVQSLNQALSTIRLPMTGDKFYSLTDANWKTPGTLIANLKVNGGHPPALNEAQAKPQLLNAVSAAANKLKYTVAKLQLANRPDDLTTLQKLYDALEDPSKVRYPAPDSTGTPGLYGISDAWLETQPGANATAPLNGTLTFQTKPLKDGATPVAPADLEKSFTPQANAQITAIADLKGKITVTASHNDTGK